MWSEETMAKVNLIPEHAQFINYNYKGGKNTWQLGKSGTGLSCTIPLAPLQFLLTLQILILKERIVKCMPNFQKAHPDNCHTDKK